MTSCLSEDESSSLSRIEVQQMTGAIANTFIRNLAMYQYVVLENPKEFIELHHLEVQTPMASLPLCEGVEVLEIAQDDASSLETASPQGYNSSMRDTPIINTSKAGTVKGFSPKSTTSKTSTGSGRK